MDDALLVRGFERARDLPRVGDRVVDRHRPRRELLRQRLALDELEHERADAIRFDEAVNRRDVGMIECGERVRFLPQPRHPIVVSGCVRRLDGEHFECDIPVEREIAGLVDLSHAAAADQVTDAEVQKDIAGRPAVVGEHGATVEQSVRCLVGPQHPFDGRPQRGVVAAGVTQQAIALGARPCPAQTRKSRAPA